MLLTEVYIPDLQKRYDLLLDPEAAAGEAASAIRDLILSAEGMCIEERECEEKPVLADLQSGKLLPENRTLRACHVKNGSRLTLL